MAPSRPISRCRSTTSNDASDFTGLAGVSETAVAGLRASRLSSGSMNPDARRCVVAQNSKVPAVQAAQREGNQPTPRHGGELCGVDQARCRY
ncbi:hypothetical protein MJ575_14095 [Klebsiella pneumoniae]|nr:hypothetical protein MJ575_14095 [Klebsiella pneumoniae]